eukprot:Protomagalhaensia_sp_Gyna_25__2012@NODE_207_length_4407_cov_256_562729_g161_i0_p2_GENE_NODE_207_length_4407_cov_256_562729_g161_i0NODE_207_length_4407_cov_256_562729_g161_i0_p2_ORF_typecomplete_len293_score36_60Bax1I/PF01027_20/7_8e07DUF2339/PF10101_9/0_13Gaa1/PF04114_14/0_43SecY/PF00344_20/1_9_NODE_207_length_4407_cov_256_562729_g161_i055933
MMKLAVLPLEPPKLPFGAQRESSNTESTSDDGSTVAAPYPFPASNTRNQLRMPSHARISMKNDRDLFPPASGGSAVCASQLSPEIVNLSEQQQKLITRVCWILAARFGLMFSSFLIILHYPMAEDWWEQRPAFVVVPVLLYLLWAASFQIAPQMGRSRPLNYVALVGSTCCLCCLSAFLATSGLASAIGVFLAAHVVVLCFLPAAAHHPRLTFLGPTAFLFVLVVNLIFLAVVLCCWHHLRTLLLGTALASLIAVGCQCIVLWEMQRVLLGKQPRLALLPDDYVFTALHLFP